MNLFRFFVMAFSLVACLFLVDQHEASAAGFRSRTVVVNRGVRSRAVVVNRGFGQRAVVVNNFGTAVAVDQFGRAVVPFSFHGSSAFGFAPVSPFGFQSFNGFVPSGGFAPLGGFCH